VGRAKARIEGGTIMRNVVHPVRGTVKRRGGRLLLVVTVLLAAAAGVAYATTFDDGNVYTACKLNATGTIRLINPSLGSSSLLGHCTRYETQFTWNQTGQQGPPGAAGANGTNGVDGKNGADGSAVAWAQVNPNGGSPVLVLTKNFDSVTSPTAGIYCLRAAEGIDLSKHAPVATQEVNFSSTLGFVTVRRSGIPNSYCPSNELQVNTWDGNAAITTVVDTIGFDVSVP
jgi:hypothetical protein